MVWYQRNYTMPYISKNVWCQAHYTQQHHQEERGGIFGGLFFVFSSHLKLKQPLKIPIKTSHTERQLFLCSQRWWENNVFTKLKIRADPSFYRGKGWELRLASINCRAHPVSERCISVEQKGGKIGRFQHLGDKGLHQVLWETKECSGWGVRNCTFMREPAVQLCLADLPQPEVFWEHLGNF